VPHGNARSTASGTGKDGTFKAESEPHLNKNNPTNNFMHGRYQRDRLPKL
jgi:hypothetical protein